VASCHLVGRRRREVKATRNLLRGGLGLIEASRGRGGSGHRENVRACFMSSR